MGLRQTGRVDIIDGKARVISRWSDVLSRIETLISGSALEACLSTGSRRSYPEKFESTWQLRECRTRCCS